MSGCLPVPYLADIHLNVVYSLLPIMLTTPRYGTLVFFSLYFGLGNLWRLCRAEVRPTRRVFIQPVDSILIQQVGKLDYK